MINLLSNQITFGKSFSYTACFSALLTPAVRNSHMDHLSIHGCF